MSMTGTPLARCAAFCASLLALLCDAGRAGAAAGLSDVLATEACWLKPPYALLKCQSDGGRYKAELVRGRERLPTDDWDYDGIVRLEDVESQVERVALTPRFAILEVAWGGRPSYTVVDLEDAKAEAVRVSGEDEVRQYLRGQGEDDSSLRFQTFEEVYRERGPFLARYRVAFGWVEVALLAAGVVGLLCSLKRVAGRRGRRATS